jgi:sulfite reductase alpha subunit-like flavoprotein
MLCGNGQTMVKDVKNTLRNTLGREKFDELITSDRWMEEVWEGDN